MADNPEILGYDFTVNRTDKNSDNSAKMWIGYSDGPVNNKYTTYFQSFNSWRGGSDWTVTEVAGSSTQAQIDEVGGGLLITNAAADNDCCQMQHGKGTDGTAGEWVLPRVDKKIYFECRLKISDATQSDMFLGLTTTDTDIINSYPTNYIGFRKDDGDTQTDCINKDGTTEMATTAAAVMDTNYHTYGFKVTGLTKVEYYIDDVLVATHTGNIPATEMRPSFAVQNGEAVAKTATLKYIRVACEN